MIRNRFRRLSAPSCQLLAFCLLAGSLLFGCTSPSPAPTVAATQMATAITIAPSATASPTPTASPQPTRAGPTATPTSRATPTAMELVLEKTVAIRGLPTREPVRSSFLPRDQLRAYLSRALEKNHAREAIAKEKGLYVSLDLIDPEVDLYEVYLSLLTEQVLGFYEFEGRELKVIGTGTGTLSTVDELTMVHEYVHALQDQHFRLGPRSREIKGSAEASLALQALSEGDATLAMATYAKEFKSTEQILEMQRQALGADQKKLESAPEIVQVNTLFPYTQGAQFVAYLVRSGGWEAVNKAYLEPPTTTEQILHPEKYTRGERPERVTTPELASALGEGWQQVGVDTLGELGWIMYFGTELSVDRAGKAAAGWGGDQYVVLKHSSGRYALAALTIWDSATDAREFHSGLKDLWNAKKRGSVTSQGDTVTWAGAKINGFASLKGHYVLMVLSPDEKTTRALTAKFGGF